jgi:hypothetical protein
MTGTIRSLGEVFRALSSPNPSSYPDSAKPTAAVARKVGLTYIWHHHIRDYQIRYRLRAHLQRFQPVSCFYDRTIRRKYRPHISKDALAPFMPVNLGNARRLVSKESSTSMITSSFLKYSVLGSRPLELGTESVPDCAPESEDESTLLPSRSLFHCMASSTIPCA